MKSCALSTCGSQADVQTCKGTAWRPEGQNEFVGYIFAYCVALIMQCFLYQTFGSRYYANKTKPIMI
jgi:hypothetical protein